MKKNFLLFLVVFLIANNVWSKPILEIASYQDEGLQGRLSSAMNVNELFVLPVDDLKKTLKKRNPHKFTNIETRFYVDSEGFVVIGDGRPLPIVPGGVQKNDLVVTGNLFVGGEFWNPYPYQRSYNELKIEVSALKDEMTDLKSEIAELKAETMALRK